MLTPHNPSTNLHPPGRAPALCPEDLADVHITVVPSTKPETERPAARATPSGRSASVNRRPSD